ncbi:hypothetical protein FB45DRAFT_915878 [Roridomyces roridus]|uniref:PARP-type domain-containing protein n=1 Tax=Roridomyces roridus TaxID=1738132 RepID=A0AAD7BU40_9AGAR|nr:hypothetical protein FB45DRAFT_915878 [Roridomyces roridus]
MAHHRRDRVYNSIYNTEPSPGTTARCKGWTVPRICGLKSKTVLACRGLIEHKSVRVGQRRHASEVNHLETYMSFVHWGCVSNEKLAALKADLAGRSHKLISGYTNLKEEDQARVSAAIDAGHIAPGDVSGQPVNVLPIPAGPDIEQNRIGAEAMLNMVLETDHRLA